MPTVIRETVKPMATHSSKRQRSMAPKFLAAYQRRDAAANCEAARRAKNVADAKARDERIKERAKAKAKAAA